MTITPLQQIEVIATNIIINNFSPKLVFHDLKHVRRVVTMAKKIGENEKLSPENLELVQMTAWLAHTGLSDLDKFKPTKEPSAFFIKCKDCTIALLDEIFKKNALPKGLQSKLAQIINESFLDYEGQRSHLAKILADAYTVDFVGKKAAKRSKRLYEEMLLVGNVNTSPMGWYEMAMAFLKSHKYETAYAQAYMRPALEANYLLIEKEYKNAKKQSDFALQKELDVTDVELKDLKKKLKASRGRDDRGIQTVFRTTSKNHYTLNQMVDRKANIMISVNSLILSVIIGGLVTTRNIEGIGTVIPIFIMIWASFLSIIFAVISIRPEVTHGRFTKEDIRNKKGNLLFFGNFHSVDFKDYEWGMTEMLSDQDYLYTSMIRDIYYMGKTLNKKYRAIRLSLNIFMIGTGLSFISFIAYRFLL